MVLVDLLLHHLTCLAFGVLLDAMACVGTHHVSYLVVIKSAIVGLEVAHLHQVVLVSQLLMVELRLLLVERVHLAR